MTILSILLLSLQDKREGGRGDRNERKRRGIGYSYINDVITQAVSCGDTPAIIMSLPRLLAVGIPLL